MKIREYEGKNVDEAITNACIDLGITAEHLNYEITEKGTGGFFGIGSKPAIITVRFKESIEERVKDFLGRLLTIMNISAEINVKVKEGEKENIVQIALLGDDISFLIGKRGRTLDSLQYLVNLAINKGGEKFNNVRLDAENYRERRKKTLENLAQNIAAKVWKNKKPIALEPMNAYERKIIHDVLHKDKYCTTKSEGEEPYRYVVVILRK